MKLQKILIAFLLLFSAGVFAQNASNPWRVSLGLTMPSISDDIVTRGTTISSNDLSGSLGAPSLMLYRRITGGLSVGGQLSLGKIKNDAAGGQDFDFYSTHVGLKYGFSTDNSFSPYLKAGVYGTTSLKDGTDSFSKFTDYSNFGAVGFDLALGENFGAFAEFQFAKINENPEVSYSLISLGVSYGFGSGDSDKDGVSDKKDKCPDVPGLKEFEGCPDTDGDGIQDGEDNCPDEPGSVENNGCPDSDGDGVVDKDDECPETAGVAELGGCPDTDGDGIKDSEDECPDEAGTEATMGCPDSDGDGVADKDDKCPNEAGTSEDGCPEVKEEVLTALNTAGINILFPADGYKLMGSKVMSAVDEVKTILMANPKGVVLIQGHASEDGGSSYNMTLSRKRAEAVKSKLIELGIDSSRLEVEAFGETMPKGDNSTSIGRANSRRVEFKGKN
ncbi:MAG: OmpA family protein [Flavobacteriaceae bacterium]|tara:strand:- start:8524 stop:9861 length:1338 start_codon:yes stop_codon:yes gene_type:complete